MAKIFSYESYRNVSSLTFLDASHNNSLKSENEENLLLLESNREILCQTWDFGSSGLLSYSALDPWLMMRVHEFESLAKKERSLLVRHVVGIWEVGTAHLLPSIAHSGPATI